MTSSTRSETARRAILRFVRTTSLRRRAWFALASVATHGLFLGVALYLIDWVYPTLNAPAMWVGLAWILSVVVWHLCHRGLSLGAADGALGLQDRLRTWWSAREPESGTEAARRWLELDLSASLAALPDEARGQLWRRPMRRLLWVLPLLLVVWIIGPLGRLWILPSPFGVTQEEPRSVAGKPDPKDGEGPSGGKPGEQPKQAPKQPDPEAQPEGPPPPPDDEPPPDRQPPAEGGPPPKPILPLPGRDEFVIPKFVGEGTGAKKKSRVAVVEESEGSGPAAARDDKTSLQGGPGEVKDADRELEFQRAEERALRQRHVPVEERGMVRRYFAELLGEAADAPAGKAPPPRRR